MTRPVGRRSPLVAAVVVLAAIVAVLGIALMRTATPGGGGGGGRGADVPGPVVADDAGRGPAPDGDADADGNGVPDALDRSLAEMAGGDGDLEAAARSYAAALERALALGSETAPSGAEEAAAIAEDMADAFGCELDPDAVVVIRARLEALSLTTAAREQAYVQFDEMTGGVRHDAC